jgi:hypothetical protein
MKEETIEGNFKEDCQRLIRTTHSIETLPIGFEHYPIKKLSVKYG